MNLCADGGPFVSWTNGRPLMCDLGWRGVVVILLVLWSAWALARLLAALTAGRRKRG